MVAKTAAEACPSGKCSSLISGSYTLGEWKGKKVTLADISGKNWKWEVSACSHV